MTEPWMKCHCSDVDERGVHVLCEEPALGALPVQDAAGRVFKASMPVCTRHLFQVLRLQAEARQR